MSIPSSVLVFGRDSQLVSTRSMILEKAGFRVSTAATLPDVHRLLSEPSMDVLLLCHTLTSHESDEAVLLAQQRWPRIQTVALVSGFSDRVASSAADTVMETLDGPAKLISAVRGRLASAPGPSASSSARQG